MHQLMYAYCYCDSLTVSLYLAIYFGGENSAPLIHHDASKRMRHDSVPLKSWSDNIILDSILEGFKLVIDV